jgi:hypothetical protein
VQISGKTIKLDEKAFASLRRLFLLFNALLDLPFYQLPLTIYQEDSSIKDLNKGIN